MTGAQRGGPVRAPRRLRLSHLRGEVGSEQEMSFNRLAFAVVFSIYLPTIGSAISHTAMIDLAIWSAVAVGIFLHIRLWPERLVTQRRAFALLLDMGFLTWFLHTGGVYAAPFWPVYIWVALGNGFRFGTRWLLASIGLFLTTFGWVALNTPYWQAQPHLSAGLLIGPCVLGLYATVLIRKLSQARRQAEQASEAKSLFLASVSHELRTPLNAIIGSGALLRGTPLDREQREIAGTIDDAAQLLLARIAGILDFSRIEAGAAVSRPEPFELPALLEEVRRMLAAQARDKGLWLSVHVTPRVPLQVVCDRTQLRDVLLNLVGNAVKFTEAGGVVIAADAEEEAGAEGLTLRFEVTDTGIGIAPEALGRIFERFTQADRNIMNRFGGTGLGLAICKGLVRLLGGEIDVRSTPGRGSTFWFTAHARRGAAETTPPAAAFADMRVLLVTSDPSAAAPVGTMLAEWGARIAVREAAPAAMALLWQAEPAGPAVPVHLLLCGAAEVDDPEAPLPGPPGPEEARSLVALGVEEAGAGGLPPTGIRQRCLAALPARPAAEALEAVLRFARPPPAEPAAAPAREASAAVPTRPLRALVVDDNAVNRNVVRRILERAGHAVVLAENGERALDALEEESFDVVLMDLNMPVLDGIEATKMVRFTSLGGPHVPIIGLTADASPEAAERCIAGGMDACLTKPVEPERLLEAISAVVDAPPGAVSPPPPPRQVADIASHPNFRRAASPTGPAIDAAVAERLAALGGADFLAGLARDFLGDAEVSVATLEGALQSRDVGRFRSAAHALRSSAASLGAMELRAICGAAEAVRAAELETAGRAHLRLIAKELERVRLALAPGTPGQSQAR